MAIRRIQLRYEIGLASLGVMGGNFYLNMADHGFSAAGYEKDSATAEALCRKAK